LPNEVREAEFWVMKCPQCPEDQPHHLFRHRGDWKEIVKCDRCGWEWKIWLVKYPISMIEKRFRKE